jgi:DNA primase
MYSSAKYLIHAEVRTDGVVERSDVVGAIFGQTEGLLGEQLDLRDLQDSSKIGRIDVRIESEGGRSFGTVTIASGLDRVETAVLAAGLETIERVGPCRAECTVTHIEDARAAKRRELVDRATELLGQLEETTVTTEQIVDEVRQRSRVEEITEYEGYPAGPRVADSDAIIVVEGRADVRRLLKYGIKNAVAVEGTDIPEEIADLTYERNTTAFLDGDRGGDLILRELAQVGNVDYVAFAPSGRSVEDLDRETIRSSLRRKVPYEQVADGQTAREAFAPTDGGAVEPATPDQHDGPQPDGEPQTAPASPRESTGDDAEGERTDADAERGQEQRSDVEREASAGTQADSQAGETTAQPPRRDRERGENDAGTVVSGGEAVERSDEPGARDRGETDSEIAHGTETADDGAEPGETTAGTSDEGAAGDGADESGLEPETLPGHVEAVIGQGRGTIRLLDGEFGVLDEADAEDAFEVLADADAVPGTVVLDGVLSQRLLDVAAQRGVGQVVAADTGEFVKQPTSVRVRTANELEADI